MPALLRALTKAQHALKAENEAANSLGLFSERS